MEGMRQGTLARLEEFIATPLDGLLAPGDPAERALALFREVAATVPAYREFLAEHGIDPDSVRTPADFARLPLIDKANYVRRHKLADLCRGGRLESCDMVALSSGSTGQPTPWPRALADELAIAVRFEQVFRDALRAHEVPTLAVVCFALGTWVGGMFTTSCVRYLAAKGYRVVTVTPGNNREEIFRAVRELAPAFEQTILLGYPPFLKEIVDAGSRDGIDWAARGTRLVMAGEVFSEEWRSLMCARIGAADPTRHTASLYGTADAGVLGTETPLSIAIRRFLSTNPEAARSLFGAQRLPTLVQYDPTCRYFEERDGSLLFTGDNGVPLVRYHIADTGGLVGFDAMLDALARHGFDPRADLAPDVPLRPLPFAYVFGRSNFAVSYFGANVFPEMVSIGLEQDEVRDWVSGKFVMEVEEGLGGDPTLRLTVELAAGEKADEGRAEAVAASVLAQLRRLNSEFAHYVPELRQRPRVELRPFADPEHFPPGIKHRYTRAPR